MVKPSLAALAARYGSDTPPRVSGLITPRNPQGVPSKPSLDLDFLPNMAVLTPTQKSYNLLMQVLECASWVWMNGQCPTSSDIWHVYKGDTCILASGERIGHGHGITYGPRDFFLSRKDSLIISREFYTRQKVTPELLRAVQRYFESK